MDLLCERCGEPWELDYIQFEMTDEERQKFHRGKGCPSCRNKADTDLQLSPRQQDAASIQSAMRDVLGSDLDGLAAEMEDLGLT